MTSIPLHGMPSWHTVAGEQIRAVGLMTRLAGVGLIAVLTPFVVAVLRAAIQERNTTGMQLRTQLLQVEIAPWAAIFAIAAALFAISMWRREDSDHRSYHWMMPVAPHVHTLTRVMAGWLWVLAATAVTLAIIATLGAVSLAIMEFSRPAGSFGWSFWIVPITSATIAYALMSAAAVGTRQPLLWVAGVILVYSGLLLSLDVLGYRDTHGVVRTAFTGEYGLTAALFGDIQRLDTAHLRMAPSVGRWLGASALWGSSALALLVATSYRRAEPSEIGAHGPFRRAVFGHAWLVASVVALSIAAGVVATSVMKPEYEARTTIWNDARPTDGTVVSVPEQRLTKMGDQADLMRSWGISDTVVRALALYVRSEIAADTSLLKNLSIKDPFVPGAYRLAIDDRGTRWQLRLVNGDLSENGAAGDSVGRTAGLRWRPEPSTLARFAGREVGFTIVPPRDAVAELQSRLTVMQPVNSSFMQLIIADSDPHRAARTLNAIAFAYVAKAGTTKSILDSAVAPRLPFKNSPTQLFGMSLVVGVAAAIGLAFAATALEERLRRT